MLTDKHHQMARRWFEITLPPLSWELAELSLNSQGTHRLIQPLPLPIYTHIRHRHGTGSHGHNSLLTSWQVAHNSSGSDLKYLSGYSQGRLTATLSAHSGLLRVFGSQPLTTCQLIGARHTKTRVLYSKHLPLPRTLLRTLALCSLVFVIPHTLGSIPCHTPHCHENKAINSDKTSND